MAFFMGNLLKKETDYRKEDRKRQAERRSAERSMQRERIREERKELKERIRAQRRKNSRLIEIDKLEEEKFFLKLLGSEMEKLDREITKYDSLINESSSVEDIEKYKAEMEHLNYVIEVLQKYAKCEDQAEEVEE